MEEKSYPWPSVPSMLILVPFLFPKYLLGPYRVPSTYFQAALCTCIKMCRNHCTRPICFTGQHPPSPKSPVPRSREAGPLVSHSPGLRSLEDVWENAWALLALHWEHSGRPSPLICAKASHDTQPTSFLGSALGNQGS